MIPPATPQQHEHELAALELIEHPVVQEARPRVHAHWLEAMQPSDAMRACFDQAFEEVMFSAAIWASNQDPLWPRVICITRLAHVLQGKSIPGSRWGIDNPDSVYRVIPISGDEEYRIHGQVSQPRLTENYFTLWDENMNSVDVLNGKELELDSDGRFTITVDNRPADGRRNHVQSAPEAHEFYIRDVLLDWATDSPNQLEVERTGPPPPRGPESPDERAARIANFMLKYADFTTRLSKGSLRQPANRFALAYEADQGGALRNQFYVGGHFKLEDGEAFVIDLADGGAEYFTVPVANVWGTTLDIVHRTSSLNKAQSVPNPDGSYTFVLGPEDPGVHNWIDTCGKKEGMLTLRMAEFPGGKPATDVSARGRVVALDSLDAELPEGTIRLDAAGREKQRRERAAGYLRRLPEGEG